MMQKPIDGFYNLLPLVQRRSPINSRDWLKETPNHLAQAQPTTSTKNQILPKTEDNTTLFVGGGLVILVVAAIATYGLWKSGRFHFLRQRKHRANLTQEAKAIDRYQTEFILKKDIPKPQSESPLANPPTATTITSLRQCLAGTLFLIPNRRLLK